MERLQSAVGDKPYAIILVQALHAIAFSLNTFALHI